MWLCDTQSRYRSLLDLFKTIGVNIKKTFWSTQRYYFGQTAGNLNQGKITQKFPLWCHRRNGLVSCDFGTCNKIYHPSISRQRKMGILLVVGRNLSCFPRVLILVFMSFHVIVSIGFASYFSIEWKKNKLKVYTYRFMFVFSLYSKFYPNDHQFWKNWAILKWCSEILREIPRKKMKPEKPLGPMFLCVKNTICKTEVYSYAHLNISFHRRLSIIFHKAFSFYF